MDRETLLKQINVKTEEIEKIIQKNGSSTISLTKVRCFVRMNDLTKIQFDNLFLTRLLARLQVCLEAYQTVLMLSKNTLNYKDISKNSRVQISNKLFLLNQKSDSKNFLDGKAGNLSLLLFTKDIKKLKILYRIQLEDMYDDDEQVGYYSKFLLIDEQNLFLKLQAEFVDYDSFAVKVNELIDHIYLKQKLHDQWFNEYKYLFKFPANDNDHEISF
jgi:hypothetical protein